MGVTDVRSFGVFMIINGGVLDSPVNTLKEKQTCYPGKYAQYSIFEPSTIVNMGLREIDTENVNCKLCHNSYIYLKHNKNDNIGCLD